MNQNDLFQSSNYFRLDRAWFIRMLELEKLFHDKQISLKQISELVGMYARCVEYYDSIKDDSKYYYIDKIQYVLSRKESLEMIFRDQSTPLQQQKQDLTISDFVIDFNYDQSDTKSGDLKISGVRCSIAGKPKNQQKPQTIIEEDENVPIQRESVARRKMQNEYKMNVEIYGKGEQEKEDVKFLVHETEKQFNKNDEIIKQELNDQDKLMMERIAKKKAKLNEKKKKKVMRANSFDQEEMDKQKQEQEQAPMQYQEVQVEVVEANDFGRISVFKQNDGTKNNPIMKTINLNTSMSKNPLDDNLNQQYQDKKKREEIQELKQSFNQQYNKLFSSINFLNYSKQIKQQQQLQQQLPQEHKLFELGSQSLLTQSTAIQEAELVKESSAYYNESNNTELDSIIQGRITLKNPFEDEDEDEEE